MFLQKSGMDVFDFSSPGCFSYSLAPSNGSSQEVDCTVASARRVTHSVVAGGVDNVNLLEVPVQEVSADSQDVAAAAVVLLHRHRLRQARARHRGAAAGGEETATGNDRVSKSG